MNLEFFALHAFPSTLAIKIRCLNGNRGTWSFAFGINVFLCTLIFHLLSRFPLFFILVVFKVNITFKPRLLLYFQLILFFGRIIIKVLFQLFLFTGLVIRKTCVCGMSEQDIWVISLQRRSVFRLHMKNWSVVRFSKLWFQVIFGRIIQFFEHDIYFISKADASPSFIEPIRNIVKFIGWKSTFPGKYLFFSGNLYALLKECASLLGDRLTLQFK